MGYFWSKDPLYSCVKTFDDASARIVSINEEIKETFPKKKLIDRWVDGFAIDQHFSKDYKNSLVITNNIVTCTPEQSPYIYTVNQSIYGTYYNNFPIIDICPQKDFNCLINRFDLFRQSWLYQIIRRDLFNRGYISFNADLRWGRVPGPEYENLTEHQAFELGFQQHNSIFKDEHEFIKDQIPYRNFIDCGDVSQIILDSKFSIILETFFHDNRIITYSEKIFRCLQLPRPWVLFATQYSVNHLRTLGFDVLDDIVNHEYDIIADSIQRQTAILDQCELLVNIDINQILSRCLQASKHNNLLLQSMKASMVENLKLDFKKAKEQLFSR